MTDDKARIEALEADVKVLTAALHSVAAWSVKTAPLRQRQAPPVSVLLSGQEQTKEILAQLK